MARLLVIEEKGELQALIKRRFPKNKLSLDAVRAIGAAADRFAQAPYDMVIWDRDGSKVERAKGFESLEVISKNHPLTQFIIVSDRGAPHLCLDEIEASCQTLQRPVDEDKLCRLIQAALEDHSTGAEVGAGVPDVCVPVEFEGIIAVSLSMSAVIRQIMEAASVDLPVLITGETGTGKDLAAAAIHRRSRRSGKPYLPVNTGAMTPELIASELFGHEKGAYTGAFEARCGLFEQADGGTIFLDEISTMNEKTQVSLLRVLESKTFRRVGGERDIRADVRVIAATNEDLENAVKQRKFREDLYYRLDVLRIALPPLRARPGAVTVLTDHFVSHFDAVYKKNIRHISPETYRCLRRYPWPGNVRELKNVIQRAVLMAQGKELSPNLIPARIREAGVTDESPDRQIYPIRVGMPLEAVEKEFIAMTLGATGGNKKEAAAMLRISRRALYNKLKRHGLS